MSTPPDGLLEVGRIGRPHGIRGDVYVTLSTDRIERLDVGARLYGAGRWFTVASAAQSGPRWLVRFDDLTDRTTAERLVGTPLYAEPIDDPDALWVHELIGGLVVEADGT